MRCLAIAIWVGVMNMAMWGNPKKSIVSFVQYWWIFPVSQSGYLGKGRTINAWQAALNHQNKVTTIL